MHQRPSRCWTWAMVSAATSDRRSPQPSSTAMTARWLIALLESYQEPDGSVLIPEVLHRHGSPAGLAPRSLLAKIARSYQEPVS